MLAALVSAPILISEVLTIGSVGRGGRIPFPTDLVVDQIIQGTWKNPNEGDTIGERKWETAKAGEDGWFNGLRGYAYAKVDWPKYQVMVLKAGGHGMVYVNGEPRMGDPYGYNYSQLPIAMKPGANHFLFANGRGRLRAELVAPPSDLFFNLGDMTTPDLIAGLKRKYSIGAILVNATEGRSQAQKYEIKIDGKTVGSGNVPRLKPLEARKVPLTIDLVAPAGEKAKCTLTLDGRTPVEFELGIRQPNQTHKVTFISKIDGSVQYYGVVPPTKPGAKALVLTVHGASVEAIGQAQAYSAKDWCWIVAPTNRRPYGFDWEEIGRMDALEVMELASQKYGIDRSKVYLTGHSMGGHGTWILGATFPQYFAALAPSAGWRSFFTYGGKPVESGDEVVGLLSTASNTSATQLLYDNYKNQEIYILHGDADDNVPVSEARAMKKVFEDMGKSIGYYEEPKAGHWWDGDKSPGADCVDWPPIFEMFQKRSLEGAKRWGYELRFTTVNPAVSSGYDGLRILQQEQKLRPSSFVFKQEGKNELITTANVRSFQITGSVVGRKDSGPLVIDGQTVAFPQVRGNAIATKEDGVWKVGGSNAQQFGPFKEAFTNRLAFVYGTKGTLEQNKWMYAKARFDAEQLWYRGNGGAELLSDDEALSAKGRNLVVYGNSRINKAWEQFVGKGPLDPDTNQGLLMIRPEGGRFIACVGGEGMAGLRSTERLPYFVSGVGYPDWTVFSKDIAAKGNDGVLGVGYWNHEGGFGENARR